MFSCKGIRGLEAKPFQKASERRSSLSTSPWVCRLLKYQSFYDPGHCTLEWVRQGSHELFIWRM